MKRIAWLTLPAVFFSCNRHTPVIENNVTPVRLSTVEKYTPAEGERYSASIMPNKQVSLAFRVNGIVDSLDQVRGSDGRMRSVDMGDVVARGTVLARVRLKDYQLQVAQAGGQAKQAQDAEQAARAQLQQAEAAAVKAQQDFARADALYKKTSLTKSDYDAAKANRDATQAQVEAARAQMQASSGAVDTSQAALGTASLSLNDTALVAPFSGVVVQRSVETGMLAGPSVSAFVLADVSAVKGTFAVSDIVVSHLRKGSKLSVYTEAFPNRTFTGFVSAIAPVADSSTRAFQIEVTVANPHATLRPGMIASLNLGGAAGSDAVTAVPLNSIVRSAGGSSQFAVVVVSDGIARRAPVALGETYGDRIGIRGVEAGKLVVSSGATFLSDGERVKVIP